MLEAVRRISDERSLPAELAMEEAMACGFGACFGCAVRTKTGYRRLCVDGPVISAADLDEGWSDP
jgi:NAD(P)H-flavin reductase